MCVCVCACVCVCVCACVCAHVCVRMCVCVCVCVCKFMHVFLLCVHDSLLNAGNMEMDEEIPHLQCTCVV